MHFTTLTRALGAAVSLIATVAAHGQALPPGVRLGMSAEALQAALPGVERVRRPQRLAGGLAGTWHAAPTALAGLSFDPVFFFAGDALRRVEWAAPAEAQPDLGAAAFAELVAWGRSRFGAELGSSDPGSAYAAWVQGDTDVYVQRTSDPRHASVRLVYKVRQLRDAGEL
ncbi:hypothetical protein [Variovorax sp. GT1P44]|uniref:hypothetical protein n=1 Tax=Variovorax sp. GT1P44 TaxID=3443742 RepID=UPI003F450AC8